MTEHALRAHIPGSTSAAAGEPELVRHAQRGSRAAATTLFERHWDGAWRTAFAVTGSRALADEVAQDAFERAFATIGRLDGRRSFAAWLHRLVVNRAIDVLRVEGRLTGLSEAHEPADAGGIADAGDRRVIAALGRLDLDRRTVVVLRHLLDLPPAEIADLLGIPVGTVHSRLARGLADLRRALAADV